MAEVTIPEEAIEAATTTFPEFWDRFGPEVKDCILAAAPLIVAAELESMRDAMRQRAVERHQIHGDNGDPCEDCQGPDDCHTVASVDTWESAADWLGRRASELRGEA